MGAEDIIVLSPQVEIEDEDQLRAAAIRGSHVHYEIESSLNLGKAGVGLRTDTAQFGYSRFAGTVT